MRSYWRGAGIQCDYCSIRTTPREDTEGRWYADWAMSLTGRGTLRQPELREAHGMFSSTALGRCPQPWSWTCSLQDCEMIHFYHQSHPVCGKLLRRPSQMNTSHIQSGAYPAEWIVTVPSHFRSGHPATSITYTRCPPALLGLSKGWT